MNNRLKRSIFFALLSAGLMVSTTMARAGVADGQCTPYPPVQDYPLSSGSQDVTWRIPTTVSCGWGPVATNQPSWVHITRSTGNGWSQPLTFHVDANPHPYARTASMSLGTNGTSGLWRLDLTQQGIACQATLSTVSLAFENFASSKPVHVNLNSTECTWTATNGTFARVTVSGSDANVAMPANSGDVRPDSVTIAGIRVAISQARGTDYCAISTTLSSSSVTLDSNNSATVQVSAPSSCVWNVAGNSWARVSVAGASSGSGSRSVTISADPYTGAARTIAVTIAGKAVTVTQTPNCKSFTLTGNLAFGSDPSKIDMNLAIGPTCGWTATPDQGWITVSPASSTGPATIHVSATTNPGPGPRTGRVMVNGFAANVTQAAPPTSTGPTGVDCRTPNFAVSSNAVAFPAHGGKLSIQVTGKDGCSWTAQGAGPVTVSPAVSTHPGTVTITAARTDLNRMQTLTFTIAGHSITASIRPWVADFDGDGNADIDIFRPASAVWYMVPSSGICPAEFTRTNNSDGRLMCTVQFGLPGDVPIGGDYDGDGRKDVAVWRPGTGMFYVLPSSGSCPAAVPYYGAQNGHIFCGRQWGLSGDKAVPADFDGDGLMDPAVWRPSEGKWYMLPSSGSCPSDSTLEHSNSLSFCSRVFGQSGDTPIQADYDGDGLTDFAFRRPSIGTSYMIPSAGGCPAPWQQDAQAGVCHRWLGAPEDIAVPADFDGDRKADLGIFRPSQGTWYVLPSSGVCTGPLPSIGQDAGWNVCSRFWGGVPQKFVPADFDGDGKADLAVWDPQNGQWYLLPTGGSCPLSFDHPNCNRQFGLNGDVPQP